MRKIVLLLLASACSATNPRSLEGADAAQHAPAPSSGTPSTPREEAPSSRVVGEATIRFASDATWVVFAEDPSRREREATAGEDDGERTHHGRQRPLGAAQPVCLAPATPSSCAPGATLYSDADGWAGAWSADLSPIPGAQWIWAPCLTRDAVGDDRELWFSSTFLLRGTPTGGTLSLAVDDWAQVLVNGAVVPLPDGSRSSGSRTDQRLASAAQARLATFDLLPFLQPGVNVITVHAANGPREFAGCTASCPYARNPAGVVFGGWLTYAAQAVCR